jgi:hypothetical protein
MRNLRHFQEFVGESYGDPQTMSANAIADYITNVTPDESDVPDYFISQIKKSGKTFELKSLSIEELLKTDSSLREYVESGEERYGSDSESDYEPDPDDINYPIVVFNGEVVDGYSRTSAHYQAGEKFIEAYVSI